MRRSRALVALCVVLLQLVTALHFSLIPHGFNAGLSGFVHVHAVPAAFAHELGPERRAASRPAVTVGSVSCTKDSCPLGFAGPSSVLLGSSQATGLVGLALAALRAPESRYFKERSRVLLAAPKTSPPA